MKFDFGKIADGLMLGIGAGLGFKIAEFLLTKFL